MTRTIVTNSEDETVAAGRQLAGRVGVGTAVLLYGELGAGKTALVRGLAEGLGVSPEDVNSPTFTLVQEYRGRIPFYHVDLYRLAAAEADDLGLEELSQTGAVAVEWAEKWVCPAGRTIDVRLEDLGGSRRRLVISADEAAS
jgi:tRNA threonylcarbamoyladenosine biosynthesis protein TsaE